MHVRDAAEDYLSSLKRLQPLTVVGYSQRLLVFCDWCEAQSPPIALEQVKNRVVDDFVEHLKQTHHPQKNGKPQLSTETVAGYVRVILQFLHWCLDDEEYSQFVKPIVVNRIKKPRVEQTVIETFTKEQLDALFLACDREYNAHLKARDKAILALLLDTGIRASELCTLTIGNVHFAVEGSYILVHGKFNKWREVGLGDKSKRLLRSYLRTFREGSPKTAVVFIARSGNRQLTIDGLKSLVARLGRWADISGVRCSPHTFRHTFACTFLLQGGDLYALSRLMGHTSVRVTERYLRAVKARQARTLQGNSVLDNL